VVPRTERRCRLILAFAALGRGPWLAPPLEIALEFLAQRRGEDEGLQRAVLPLRLRFPVRTRERRDLRIVRVRTACVALAASVSHTMQSDAVKGMQDVREGG
jgi:hypothetical protein